MRQRKIAAATQHPVTFGIAIDLERKTIAAQTAQASMQSSSAGSSADQSNAQTVGVGKDELPLISPPNGEGLSSQAFKEELASKVATYAERRPICGICRNQISIDRAGYVPHVNKFSVITRPCKQNTRSVHAICFDCMIGAVRLFFREYISMSYVRHTLQKDINDRILQIFIAPHLAGDIDGIYDQYRQRMLDDHKIAPGAVVINPALVIPQEDQIDVGRFAALHQRLVRGEQLQAADQAPFNNCLKYVFGVGFTCGAIGAVFMCNLYARMTK